MIVCCQKSRSLAVLSTSRSKRGTHRLDHLIRRPRIGNEHGHPVLINAHEAVRALLLC